MKNDTAFIYFSLFLSLSLSLSVMQINSERRAVRRCHRNGKRGRRHTDGERGLPFRTSAVRGGTFKSRCSKGGCVNLRTRGEREGYKNPKFFRTSQMEAPRVERDLQREEEEEGYG